MAEQEPRPRHETRDVPLRPFLIFAAIMIAGAVLMHVVLAVLSGVFHEVNVQIQGVPAPVALGPTDPPTPALLLSDQLLKNLHRLENEELNGYRWADPKQGFVEIPIEQAMEIVAAHGLPDWRNETDFRYW